MGVRSRGVLVLPDDWARVVSTIATEGPRIPPHDLHPLAAGGDHLR